MSAHRRIQASAALLLVAALSLSFVLTSSLAAIAGRAELGYADRAEESDPPEVAVGIALGAFRGLFVNLLWLRAERLKDEGKFFESMELAKTITRLQPRFPRVWSFQAWNMAYNISVATKTPEERWQWVKAGVDLLRKEGIPKNPNDPWIHKELAWIFNHKIQGFTDDANQYYKRRVAENWTIALGKPPPRDADTRVSTQRYADWLAFIANAPDTLEQAIQREPVVATLVERIRTEAKLPLDQKLLRAVELQISLRESWAARAGLITLTEANRNDALSTLIDDESLRPGWMTLLPHLRRRLLIDEYHMEPARMIRYTLKYGPLDWRHPSTHALYWALRGVEQAQGRVHTDDFDLTNADRIVLHAAQELARWGDLSYDILSDDSYIALPSPDFIPLYGRLLLDELQQRARFAERMDVKIFTTYGLGYENFLRDAIRFYYRAGNREQAQQYYDELRTFPGININDPLLLQEELSLPLDDFVLRGVEERIDSPYIAIQEFDGAMTSAFLALARGDPKAFESQTAYARSVHNAYMQMQLRRTHAGGERERTELFDRVFEFAAADSFVGLVIRQRIALQDAALIYRRAPLWLQQPVYERLALRLNIDPERKDTLAVLFPVPPNYEDYLARVKQLREQEDDRARKQQVEIERN